MANLSRRLREIPESGTVTVACNFNTGIVLQLYDFEETEEPVLGGGTKMRKVAVAVGDPVKLNGPRIPAGGPAPSFSIIAGWALTPNVDAQFMQRWMKENANTALVKNECILVYEVENDARAAAKDHRDSKSGLEPIAPGLDAKGQPIDKRLPKKRSLAVGSLGAVGPADVLAA